MRDNVRMDVTNGYSEKVPEFTKKQLYEYWEGLLKNSKNEYKDLLQKLENTPVKTVNVNITEDQMKLKREKYLQSLLMQTKKMVHPQHLNAERLNSSMNITEKLRKMRDELTQLLEEERKAVNEMEDKIKQIKKSTNNVGSMEELSSQPEKDSKTNLKAKVVNAKIVFKAYKEDLVKVLDNILPDNEGFEEFLKEITKAYPQGGDQMFIQVHEDNVVFAYFMVNANLAVFHNHEKTMIRLFPL